MGTLADSLRAGRPLGYESTPSGLLVPDGKLEIPKSLEDIFEEEPPPLTVFVQDKAYLHNPELSPLQYEAVRAIEQIFYPSLYPLMVEAWGDYWQPVPFINFATLMWGKGSGKDHICRMAALRIANLLLCLKSPLEYFHMPAQDSIHLLNVASSANQAQRAFFKPMTRAVKRGWFEDKAEPGMNLITFDKNVEAISGHSDAESQEGLNLLLSIADEIDAFKSKEELLRNRAKAEREPTKSAEALLDMMRTSGSTRFPETFKTVRISYPRFLGSTIMRLLAQSKTDIERAGSASRHFASGPHATWEVNPNVKGKEAFADDYEEDPVLSRAKYECKPSRSVDPWFRNEMAVLASFQDTPRQPIEVRYELVPVRQAEWVEALEGLPTTGNKFAEVWQPIFDIDTDQLQPILGARYAMHGDIAISRDRAGLAMSHVERWEQVDFVAFDEEGGEVHTHAFLPHVVNDFTISFEADLRTEPAREVQIAWYRLLCWDLLRRGFPILRYTFDQYQSKDTQQQLEAQGIESERVSCDEPEPYDILRDVMYGNRIRLPYRASLVDEVLALQRLPNGKPDHPPGGSKDEADALAGSVLGAIALGGSENEDREVVIPAEAGFTTFDSVDMPLDFDGFAEQPL